MLSVFVIIIAAYFCTEKLVCMGFFWGQVLLGRGKAETEKGGVFGEG